MLMITAKRAEKRKNAIESAIEDVILNRTIFFEKFFFPLFIGVCGQFLSAIENAIEKMFANRIIAFYICTRNQGRGDKEKVKCNYLKCNN
jgi:hypothetical protein